MTDALMPWRTPALKTSLHGVAWLQARAAEAKDRLQPRRIQMLLYIAQALYAAVNGCRLLVPSHFVASSLGPMDPNLYDVLEQGIRPSLPAEIEPRAEACLNLVWKRFGAMTATELETFISHDGVYETARQSLPGAVLPLTDLAEAYRRSMIEPSMPPAQAAEPAMPVDEAPVAAGPVVRADGPTLGDALGIGAGSAAAAVADERPPMIIRSANAAKRRRMSGFPTDEVPSKELPPHVPKMTTGGKAVKAWAPKRRLY